MSPIIILAKRSMIIAHLLGEIKMLQSVTFGLLYIAAFGSIAFSLMVYHLLVKSNPIYVAIYAGLTFSTVMFVLVLLFGKTTQSAPTLLPWISV